MTIATLLIALIATPSAEASGDPILLDFQASWCNPCQQMRPAIEQLIRKGYPVKEIDIDRSPDLAARYQVSGVPAFIVVDGSGQVLARAEGARPAAELARMYLDAKAKAVGRPDDAPEDQRANSAEDETNPSEKPAPARPPVNPKPWQCVVRIKIHANGAIGFGSGTIIASTPEESIVLTCAHIFKMDGAAQAPPSRFPLRITVDLFDGKLAGQQVHYANETYEGKAIDYDFSRDVGLIRIRPGRRLPASRVVPAHWKPKERMAMTTVGCSEGHDATAWNTTILNASMRGLTGNAAYEAIECKTAPKQGRSGGGLFTSDGYVAGVCDFAEPTSDHGLYAAPRSIYQILDRNRLMALYAPVSNGRPQTLLAGNRSEPATAVAPRAKAAPAIARGQSPDGEESNAVLMPSPEMLGIKAPAVAEGKGVASPSTSPSSRPGGWRRTAERAELTDLKLPPAADNDRFAPMTEAPPAAEPASEPEPAPAKSRTSGGGWRPVRSPLPAIAADRP